jgi:hypothetical protein
MAAVVSPRASSEPPSSPTTRPRADIVDGAPRPDHGPDRLRCHRARSLACPFLSCISLAESPPSATGCARPDRHRNARWRAGSKASADPWFEPQPHSYCESRHRTPAPRSVVPPQKAPSDVSAASAASAARATGYRTRPPSTTSRLASDVDRAPPAAATPPGVPDPSAHPRISRLLSPRRASGPRPQAPPNFQAPASRSTPYRAERRETTAP